MKGRTTVPPPAASPRSGPVLGVALLLSTALASASCELSTVELAEVQDVVVAEVYLRPDQDFHQAFLHRTLGRDGVTARVDGASITVRGSDGRVVTFAPANDSSCLVPNGSDHARGTTGGIADTGSCYIAPNQGRVGPGQSYVLEIDLPDGRKLSGSTTVPGDYHITRPAAPICVLEESDIQLVWTRSQGAWAYQADAVFTGLAAGLAARGVADPPDTLRLLGLAAGGNDTTMAFPGDLGIFDRYQIDIEIMRALQQGLPEGARVDVVIAAADRNYVNWVRGGNFNPSGQVRISSLHGDGIGVFAALLGRTRRIETTAPRTEGTAWPRCE